nr:Ig-like domain-containing protein [Nonomuraea spiralis]
MAAAFTARRSEAPTVRHAAILGGHRQDPGPPPKVRAVTMTESTVATFTPSAPLSTGATYTVTAGGGADAAGNVQAPHVWSFSTIAAPAAEPVNPNPYFESTIEPWEPWVNSPTVTRSTGRAHQGVASAKFVPESDFWGFAAELFEVPASGDYQLSGWFQPATTDPMEYGFDFGVEWYDADFEQVGADNFVGDPTVGQWQAVSGTVTAPDDAAWAVLYTGGAATMYFDEIMLVPGAGLSSAKAGAVVRKPRQHGPAKLLTTKGAKPKKSATRRTDGDAATATAATATTPFSYDHISMEQCLEAARQAGLDPGMGRGNLAQLVVRPYSACWSRYFNAIDYVYAAKVRKWLPKKAKKGLQWSSVRLQFQATWVMHTYLGDATGGGVENGGTSGVKPQQIKMWTKISNIKAYDPVGNVTDVDDDEFLRLEVKPTGDAGSRCTMTSGSNRETTVGGWKSDGDDEFVFTMQDTDGDKADKCTLRPTMIDVDDEWTYRPMDLWSQVVYDEQGQVIGKRTGGGDPSGNDPYEKPYTPHVRCDWFRTAGGDAEGESLTRTATASATSGVHVGACIFPLAKRIFVMSKSKDASFLQVIQHIEAALKLTGTSDNRYTVPPLRDNETQDPPVKGVFGTEKPKIIPGNWAAPKGTDPNQVEPGDPLTKDKSGNQPKNRNVFSRSFKVGTTSYTSYCQYYFPENYKEPLLSMLDPVYKRAECDEYPFASTKDGAGYAADRGMKNHYSLRAVGKSHNSTARGSHGKVLKSFYDRNRVLPDDKFWVWIVN